TELHIGRANGGVIERTLPCTRFLLRQLQCLRSRRCPPRDLALPIPAPAKSKFLARALRPSLHQQWRRCRHRRKRSLALSCPLSARRTKVCEVSLVGHEKREGSPHENPLPEYAETKTNQGSI